MSRFKKIALAVGVLFIVMQCMQPARNNNLLILPTDFAKVYTAPATVQSILQNACYNCYSNNTTYP